MKEKQKGQNSGQVFNIQKYSIHDGPGIRTIVFLKGCPLKCQWCSNPESQHPYPEVFYNDNKCIGIGECRYCLKACRAGAMTEAEGKVAIDRERCTQCGDCAEACPAKAVEVCGVPMTVDEVLNSVEEDGAFYTRSGGGITLSGGEPLVQADFAGKLINEARQRGLNTAVETTGFAEWEAIEKVLNYADTVYYDLKCMDSQKHKKYTGVANEKILFNFKKICTEFPEMAIRVRTPIVPGFNDTKREIRAIVEFIKGMPRDIEYEILPYHRLGESKYPSLGRIYPLSGVPTLEQEKLRELEGYAKFLMKN
ncbi:MULTISPECIES: glycyl-radical enzyme activating protein [Desulfitobacterium]|uniref:Glycyl-radical enzyme activator family protein n=1 Tax=Desulfitobacterium dehalogenans (strain ATCC 51507 / DSM 9161 / JW/IU-DC1) TaxID=756499 RepID=I4A4B9_DESDJ|nr:MULTISPECIES: glycyl-radical enzyme activating protein [Desulfitobacterium]AFL98803.1 glycyl-radical enzyme activator family protein [Desulfitobacterium dehalogenans ATCC 51507]